MYRFVVLLVFSGILIAAANAQSDCDLSVTFVANEGALITSDNAQILIDGLHRQYRPAYSYLPKDLQQSAEGGTGRFANTDVVLVSHVHGDHFSAQAVAGHLSTNSAAYLYSSSQVVDSVSATGQEDRMRVVDYSRSTTIQLDSIDVSIKFFPLPHSSRRFSWIKNLGHLIAIGDLTILHVGDADMAQRNFEPFIEVDERIDIAILPYWYLLDSDGRMLINDYLNPRFLIAAHISPENSDQTVDDLRQQFPDVIPFVDILKSRLVIDQPCPDN